ncbi:MAG TPA: FTR1 family protein [Stellaceae bacterium]|jgi:high-affinity iron transporter|nr:FTR1 family protein [Stellaceae bacterium]
MLATLIIVFREIIEAGLIVGIVLAASTGVRGRSLWVGYGVAVGVLGACLVAAFAGRIGALFQGAGEDLFNATILALAVIMLTWHNVWMASHGRAMALEMRQVGAQVASGERPLFALSIVVGVAVLREGSEIVLFLYGIAMAGGASTGAMLIGGVLGLIGGVAVTALMYFGLLAIPAHRLFAVTAGLITLLAAGLAAQAVVFVQQAGYADMLTNQMWNSSAILSQDSLVGRLLHTLIGYSDRPNGAQLVVYLATVIVIVVLMKAVRAAHHRHHSAKRRHVPAE